MRLPRLTTRRMMVVVAVVEIAMGCEETLRTRDRYRRRADYHAVIADIAGKRLRDYLRRFYLDTVVPVDDPRFEEILREASTADPSFAAYHAAMMRKYRRAARYPWLVVPPDPPSP